MQIARWIGTTEVAIVFTTRVQHRLVKSGTSTAVFARHVVAIIGFKIDFTEVATESIGAVTILSGHAFGKLALSAMGTLQVAQ